MTTEYIIKLYDLLKIEAETYRNLLSLSKSKTDVIIMGKVQELEAIVKAEQTIVSSIGKLEAERDKIVDKMVKTKKLEMEMFEENGKISLSTIINQMDPKQAENFKLIRKQLEKLINELRCVNDKNSCLINNSLEYIEFSINLFTGAGMAGQRYGSDGILNDEGKRNLIDVRL